MRLPVVDNWNRARNDITAIERRGRDTAAHAVRVLHTEHVRGRPPPPRDRVLAPCSGNARVDRERRTTAPKTENALQAQSIQPPGCPCVPRPSPSTHMLGMCVDVRRDD